MNSKTGKMDLMAAHNLMTLLELLDTGYRVTGYSVKCFNTILVDLALTIGEETHRQTIYFREEGTTC